MSWVFDEQPSGLYTLLNPVGRPVLDIAFRADIPPGVRELVLQRIGMAMVVLTEEEKP